MDFLTGLKQELGSKTTTTQSPTQSQGDFLTGLKAHLNLQPPPPEKITTPADKPGPLPQPGLVKDFFQRLPSTAIQTGKTMLGLDQGAKNLREFAQGATAIPRAAETVVDTAAKAVTAPIPIVKNKLPLTKEGIKKAYQQAPNLIDVVSDIISGQTFKGQDIVTKNGHVIPHAAGNPALAGIGGFIGEGLRQAAVIELLSEAGKFVGSDPVNKVLTPDDLRIISQRPNINPTTSAALNELADNNLGLKGQGTVPAGGARQAFGEALSGGEIKGQGKASLVRFLPDGTPDPTQEMSIESITNPPGTSIVPSTGGTPVTPSLSIPPAASMQVSNNFLSGLKQELNISQPPTPSPKTVAPLGPKISSKTIEPFTPPATPITPQTSITLTAGFDPGVDKLIEEDIKPALENTAQVAKTALGFVQKLTDSLVNIMDRGAIVEKRLGGEAYSQAIKAIHTPEAEQVTYTNNFGQAEKYFNNFSEKQLQDYNLTRGTAENPQAQVIQKEAYDRLPKALQDKKLADIIHQASDYVYKYATDNGIPLDYFREYFYGVYKAPQNVVNNFLDYWQTTDKYTKSKTFPTPADAYAYDPQMVLRDANPITNIGSELTAVAKSIGMQKFRTWVQDYPDLALVGRSNDPKHAGWMPIEDPVFKGMLFDPDLAKLMNNLISTNKVTTRPWLKALRQMAYLGQRIKFFGSIYHQTSMVKAIIADAPAGILDPRAEARIAKSLIPIDTNEPQYKEYINLGGGHKYSVESQALQSQFMKGIDRMMRGNYIGGALRTFIGGANAVSKFLPGSPAYVKWLFDTSIPKIKYDAYKIKVQGKEASLGRSLTDAEKISIIRENQNFYGEMNERLFGRSSTATSALRLLFNAPGFFEGNIRRILNVPFGEGIKGRAKNISFIFNSMVTLLVTAAIATRLYTGKWRKLPNNPKDYRDLLKVDTGQKDGDGNPVMVDLASFEKDDYSIFGNLVTGQPGKIPQDLAARTTGLYSSPFKIMTDVASIMEGKNLVDYKNAPIYFRTDSLATKVNKFLIYEGLEAQPISTSSFGQSQKKGLGVLESAGQAMTGLTPTNTEAVKELKSIRQDYFSLEDAQKQKQIELNKLRKENPSEAVKQMKEFNDSQRAKQKDMQTQINDLIERGIDPKTVRKYFPFGITDPYYTQLKKP